MLTNPVVDALTRFFIFSLRKHMHETSDSASCKSKLSMACLQNLLQLKR